MTEVSHLLQAATMMRMKTAIKKVIKSKITLMTITCK